MTSVGDFVTRNAFRHPNKPGVRFGERLVSWKELETRCRSLAAGLQGLGVSKGDRVAYLGQNSHRYFECYYAPSLIGAILVPLNNRHSLAEKIECVKDCMPKALLFDQGFAEEAHTIAGACGCVRTRVYAGEGPAPPDAHPYETLIEEAGNARAGRLDGVTSSGDDTLIIFYTGGTTGKPKGVMLSHNNLLFNAMGTAPLFRFQPNEVHLMTGPMFHLGTGSRVYSSVYSGAQTVILSRFEPGTVLAAIERHRVNVLVLVPTMLKMLLEHPDIDHTDLSSVRLLSYGAASMPLTLIRWALERLPSAVFAQSYGQTETSPVVAVLGPEQHDPAGADTDKLGSIGRPVPYADVRIFNDDSQPLDRGEVGEIVLRGPQVMRGYWNQPELTAEAFRGGFHHTGDAGYFDEDGFLHLAGRTKDMIVTGGENVYPVETENVLSQHPAVSESAVIGIPDDHWGEAVHAVVRLNSGEQVKESALIEYCRARLAHYKCPAGITFRAEPMPLSSVNKVMKSELRKPFLR